MAKTTPKATAIVVASLAALGTVLVAFIQGWFGNHDQKKQQVRAPTTTVTGGNTGDRNIVVGGSGNSVTVSQPNDLTQPKREEEARLAIDDFIRLPNPKTDPKRDYELEIVLRNGTDKPINVTWMEFSFDNPAFMRQNASIVSARYEITVSSDKFSFSGSHNGSYPTRWYYDESNKPRLQISTSCAQTLGPKSTDRFRVTLRIKPEISLQGPMKSLEVSLGYNEGSYVQKSIAL